MTAIEAQWLEEVRREEGAFRGWRQTTPKRRAKRTGIGLASCLGAGAIFHGTNVREKLRDVRHDGVVCRHASVDQRDGDEQGEAEAEREGLHDAPMRGKVGHGDAAFLALGEEAASESLVVPTCGKREPGKPWGSAPGQRRASSGLFA